MKPYHDLTRLGQLRRMRQPARASLDAYGLGGARLTFLRYFANVTYRVDLPDAGPPARDSGPYLPNRYLLQRPGHPASGKAPERAGSVER